MPPGASPPFAGMSPLRTGVRSTNGKRLDSPAGVGVQRVAACSAPALPAWTTRPSRRCPRWRGAPVRRSARDRRGQVRRGIEERRVGEDARDRLASAQFLVDDQRERMRCFAQAALEPGALAVVGATHDPQRRDDSREKNRQGQQDKPKTQRQFDPFADALLVKREGYAKPIAPMQHQPDSRHAVMRLGVTLVLMTIGGSGMYVVAVVLPAVQAEFGVRARRRLAALHAADGRLRHRRHADGHASPTASASWCRC